MLYRETQYCMVTVCMRTGSGRKPAVSWDQTGETDMSVNKIWVDVVVTGF